MRSPASLVGGRCLKLCRAMTLRPGLHSLKLLGGASLSRLAEDLSLPASDRAVACWSYRSCLREFVCRIPSTNRSVLVCRCLLLLLLRLYVVVVHKSRFSRCGAFPNAHRNASRGFNRIPVELGFPFAHSPQAVALAPLFVFASGSPLSHERIEPKLLPTEIR